MGSLANAFALGVGYGSLLSFLSFLCVGSGHGTEIPMYVTSALFGFGPWVALFGAPLLWGIIAAVLFSRHAPIWLPIAMIVHYKSGLALAIAGAFGDWVYVERVWRGMPWALTGWAMLYAGGQVLIWWHYLARLLRKRRVPQRGGSGLPS